ncbi:MAG: nitroreductase family protein [Pseudomonadota bacterium]
MDQPTPKALTDILAQRFADAPNCEGLQDIAGLPISMVARGACRAFSPKPVPELLIEALCAVAMASPTKSDLQQRDIIVLKSPDMRQALAALVPDQAWVAEAPMLLVFCGNNRRQRQMHDWQDLPFANDHTDALFNATADAAIALGAFITAAEVLGLGACPISAVRNEAQAVSNLLALPDHVFPFAGLALGHPKDPPKISKRLPLSVTSHVDRFSEAGLEEAVASYDAERASAQPYKSQRFEALYGQTDPYTWSQDKARQYSQPERADFGAFLRAKGFRFA